MIIHTHSLRSAQYSLSTLYHKITENGKKLRQKSGCQEKILDSIAGLRYDNTCAAMILRISGRMGGRMEKIVEQGILYDFYGELLTEHQRRIYEKAVYEDLSLSEIAEDCKISRQGVHDLLKRCDRLLAGYEEKLHLVEKFTQIKERIQKIEKLSSESDVDTQKLRQIGLLAEEILEEL